MAGFMFEQLTKQLPDGTNFYLETAYLVFTATSLGLDLCIITWTVLCCMYGPGMALRGPEGMKSFHKTVDFLKGEQQQIYLTFMASVFTYFISSCCVVWVYPSRELVNWACMGIFFLVLIVIMYLQISLELQIGGSVLSHDGADGRIKGLALFEQVADLDQYVSDVVAEDAHTMTFHQGLYAPVP